MSSVCGVTGKRYLCEIKICQAKPDLEQFPGSENHLRGSEPRLRARREGGLK